MMRITRQQARRFVLHHQGLLGPHRFGGEEGVQAFIRQAGCLQFDPVDLCGRSPEITLLSRVMDYRPDYLYTLLYEKRSLVDHFDKNLCIYPVQDWPFLRQLRAQWSDTPRSRQLTEAHRGSVLQRIREAGPQNAASLGLTGQVSWYWSSSTLARAVLEQLYNEGSLLVHSKNGVLKTYDLAERLLPPDILEAPEPFAEDLDFAAWHLLRRLRAVGLLWARASDAHLGSLNYRAEMRRQAFEHLMKEGQLLPVRVEGIKDTLYMAAQDEGSLQEALAITDPGLRCELLAPLDSFLWDRRLIRALFDFDYTWEIYTPAHKRVYGPYVLPILYGDRLVGRAAPVCDRKAKLMRLQGLWWEAGFQPDRTALDALQKALTRLAAMNGCQAASSLP